MTSFRVGFRQGAITDPARSDWSGDGARPIRWSAWYPAAECALPARMPAEPALFVTEPVAPDAPLNDERAAFPVVLMSHGTGGTAAELAWLAHRLAGAGFIVIGVDHHGNTASEALRPEGFLCWWERAGDLSVILDRLAEDAFFAGRLDMARVSALGFSLGGHTVLALAGAITEVARFHDWAAATGAGIGPRALPDLAAHIARLMRDSPVFRSSWERQSVSYRDPRMKAVVALAPAPPVRAFTPDSLAAVTVPVSLMVGEADHDAPAEVGAAWLYRHLPHGRLDLLGPDVGHLTLLNEGTEAGRASDPDRYIDAPGVDRRAVHDRVLRITLKALGGT